MTSLPVFRPQPVRPPLPFEVISARPVMRAAEMWLWCALAVAVGLLNLGHDGGPRLWNDSYQYLSVAQNLIDHGAASTALIHFDSERARGRVPAPITAFPPGYPAAIAGVAAISHSSLETAGLAISFASVVGVVPLLWFGSRLLAFPAGVTRLCLFLWIFSSDTAVFATGEVSEALFTFLALSAILLLAWYEREAHSERTWPLAAAFALLGAAYWVRYAALFLVAALLLYFVLTFRRRIADWPMWLASSATCGALIVWGMLREVAIAGAWKGARVTHVHNPLLLVAKQLAAIAYNLVLAMGKVRVDAVIALALAGLLAVTALVVRSLYRIPKQLHLTPPALLLLVCATVYCGCMIYLGFVSTISFGERMFFPMLPLLILLAGAALSAAWAGLRAMKPAIAAAALALFLLGYAAGHVRFMLEPVEPAEHQLVAADLGAPMPDGQSLRSWLQAHVSPQATIVAVDGQAVGYLLHRNTVSLPERRHTSAQWDDAQVHQVMQSFGARYLVVFPRATPGAAVVQAESPFLMDLMEGRRPAWLKPAAGNGSAQVFELQP